ncbi:MAG: hypothetical protein KAQ74_03685, partial [Dehalococcoidia bacterium]|nr:hypothetical protein [Dehalococcoidia bacterium]
MTRESPVRLPNSRCSDPPRTTGYGHAWLTRFLPWYSLFHASQARAIEQHQSHEQRESALPPSYLSAMTANTISTMPTTSASLPANPPGV